MWILVDQDANYEIIKHRSCIAVMTVLGLILDKDIKLKDSDTAGCGAIYLDYYTFGKYLIANVRD